MNAKQRRKDKNLKELITKGRHAQIIAADNEALTYRARALEEQLSSKEELLKNFRDQVNLVSASSQELTHTLEHEKEQHQHETNSIQELLSTATSTIEDLQRRNDALRTANKALHREADEATEAHAKQLEAATSDLRHRVNSLKSQLIEPDKLRRRLHAKQEEIEKLCTIISEYRFKLGLPPDEYHPFTRQVVRGAQQVQALAEVQPQPQLVEPDLPIDEHGHLLPDANDSAVAAAFSKAKAFIDHVKPTTSEVPYQFEKLEGPIRGIPVDGVVLDEAQTFNVPQSED